MITNDEKQRRCRGIGVVMRLLLREVGDLKFQVIEAQRVGDRDLATDACRRHDAALSALREMAGIMNETKLS